MDLDRKDKRGHERLTQEVEVTPPPIPGEKSEYPLVLEEKIKKLLEQVETLGEAGKVDEAEALMRKVDILNAEKAASTNQSGDRVLMLAQEKKMALCETCGSFLIANDVAERTQSHVTGKQHIGYGMVRDFIGEFKAARQKEREEERLAWEKETEERRKQREKEHETRDREREYERERSTERGRDRERSRDWRRNQYRTGRDKYRDRNGVISCDRARTRSRSRSPIRHGRRRSSRSPIKQY